MTWDRGVPGLDGARGNKQVQRPNFQPKVFQEQMYCIEARTCDIAGTFGALGIMPPPLGMPSRCVYST